MDQQMKEIQAIEDKYGLLLFRMGLAYLVDAGASNLGNEAYAKDLLKQIAEDEKEEKASSAKPKLESALKRKMLQCGMELAKYSPLTLFAYIKKHVFINGI